MRATLVISSMRGGGSERVVSHMANYWARKGWAIAIVTTSHGAEPPCYPLDPRVVHHDMRFSRAARQPIPNAPALSALKDIFDECSAPERRRLLRELDLVVALRQAIVASRPQVVISFINATNVRTLLAVRGLGLPVIVSERTDPYRDALTEGLWRLRRRMYGEAACMVGQTEDIAAFFAADVGGRVRVIHNPVLRPTIGPASDVAASGATAGRRLVAMGRLAEEKGFMLLLRAFSLLALKHPSWSLHIWGEGPQRPRLERLAFNLNLNGRVRLPGFTRRPFDALARADVFVLPSLSEGFPNALCEAMACGVPAVSFNCSSGIREIIRNGVDGLIVPAGDVPALAAALDRVMSSEDYRRSLATRAIEVVDRFAVEKVMAQWEQLALSSMSTTRVSALGLVAEPRSPAGRLTPRRNPPRVL
jgi:GalNAc-alpha-(1->4)-GalNAc-alpha-(1->3)-diNAcBac-PP-undecaprenol alpha-1,4-N-acetyl-D-galactosaminyltransferase